MSKPLIPAASCVDRTLQRLLLLLGVALATLASASRAQSAAPPEPAVGTTGTLITLDIADLGDKPPKVWLTRDDTKKRTKLKLIQASPTQLVLLLKQAPPAALYDLSIRPKGGDEFELDEAFTVLAPQGLELLNAFTTPAHHVTIEGSYLGTKKGKVRIGGKPAKVLVWEAVSGVDDPDVAVAPTGTIVAVVPKSLPDGVYPVEVSNHAGSTLTETALTLAGSPKPLKLKKPLFSAQLGDVLVSTKQVAHLAWGLEHRVTAQLDGDDGGPEGELRLRYFINTNDLPKLLEQTGFDAFLDYERPLEGGGSELFRSQDCQLTVTHVQDDGVVAGQVTATLVSDLDDGLLLLQAGLFVAPPPGDLEPEGPGPSVLSFTSAPDEPLPGQPLTYSWSTNNVDEHLTTCAIKLPGTSSASPCATSGSLEFTPLNAGTLHATLYVYDAGLLSDSAVESVLVGGPSVLILEPDPLDLVDGSVFVQAAVGSDVFEITSVTASVGDLAIPLVGGGNGFTGTLPLDSLTPGLQTLTVTAVDALGITSLDTEVFDYDKQPVLEVTLPTELQVATPTLPVYATGSDADGETVLVSVRVFPDGQSAQTLVTADDVLDTTVDLSPWDGTTLRLRVRAEDEGGWLIDQFMDVLVEGSTALTPLLEAPGQLVTLDDTGALAAYLDADADPPTYALLNLDTLAVLPVPLSPGFDVLPDLETTWRPSLRFTPTGVVYEARPQGTSFVERHLFDWNLGDLFTLSEHLDTFEVDGDYATFTHYFDSDHLLYRRRFTAQTLVSQVGGVVNGHHAVDDNGDVAWNHDDDPWQVSYKPKGLPPIALGSDPTFTHLYPRLDAGRVVYARKKPHTATLGQIMLWDGVTELALTEFTPFHFPPNDFAITGDWIAFNREGVGGQRQLWVRDLAGIETKLSIFADDSTIQALAPDGSVAFKVGTRRYLWRGTGEPQDIGSTLGWPVHRDGEWYVLLGRQLFHVP